tara:strand:+ start:639 stop:1046 length:408 start_codon:yes stop_codon:yes gene_type:complete
VNKIPRKAPNTVVEQRVTLGQFERAQLGQALQLAKRQQVIEGVTASMIPLTVAAIGFGGVIVATKAWEKINGLIPTFDGVLDGVSNTIFGSSATQEAILREAAEEAARDGEPLPLWRKALHRFGVMPKFGGGGVY